MSTFSCRGCTTNATVKSMESGACFKCEKPLFEGLDCWVRVFIDRDSEMILEQRGPGVRDWDIPEARLHGQKALQTPLEVARHLVEQRTGLTVDSIWPVFGCVIQNGGRTELLFEVSDPAGTLRQNTPFKWFPPNEVLAHVVRGSEELTRRWLRARFGWLLPIQAAFMPANAQGPVSRMGPPWVPRKIPAAMRPEPKRFNKKYDWRVERNRRTGYTGRLIPVGMRPEPRRFNKKYYWRVERNQRTGYTGMVGSLGKDTGAALWFDTAIAGDHMLIFAACSVPPCNQDITLIWEGSGTLNDAAPDHALTCGALGGWYSQRTGISLYPKGAPVAVTQLVPVEPGRVYYVAGGRFVGSDNRINEFLFVDGELVTLLQLTQDQTNLRRESKLALALYASTIQYLRAWTYGLQPAPAELKPAHNPCTS